MCCYSSKPSKTRHTLHALSCVRSLRAPQRGASSTHSVPCSIGVSGTDVRQRLSRLGHLIPRHTFSAVFHPHVGLYILGMAVQKQVHKHAQRAAYQGDFQSAFYVLRLHADLKGWTEETLRARWDGAAALLTWWHTLDPEMRPPLNALDAEDAQAFLESLKSRGLARTTVRGYRADARSLTRSLRELGTSPQPEGTYDPFKTVSVPPAKRVYALDPTVLEKEKPRVALRFELLVALLNHGMSVPEICCRKRHDLNLEDRRLLGYKKRSVKLGAKAVAACVALANATPSFHKNRGCGC